MASLQKDRVLQFRGQTLSDANGDKIGKIEEIYLDAQTDEPEWALVNTGMFGTKSTFVPVRDAAEADGELRVPFEKATVKDAPKIDPDGQLSQREESELYRYYGLDYSEARSDSGLRGSEGARADGQGHRDRAARGVRERQQGAGRGARRPGRAGRGPRRRARHRRGHRPPLAAPGLRGAGRFVPASTQVPHLT